MKDDQIKQLMQDLESIIGPSPFDVCGYCNDYDEDYSHDCCEGIEDWDGRPCWYEDWAKALIERGWTK